MSEAAILRDLAGVQSRLLFPHAVALARMGGYAEAEQCVRVLFEHAPSADACCLLGRMFGQQARYDDAAAAFEQALTIEPGHPEAGVALECVRARARPGSAASLRTWRLIGATAVMIVIAAVATFVRVTPQGRVTSSASNAAVAPAARDADGVNPDVAAGIETERKAAGSQKCWPSGSIYRHGVAVPVRRPPPWRPRRLPTTAPAARRASRFPANGLRRQRL